MKRELPETMQEALLSLSEAVTPSPSMHAKLWQHALVTVPTNRMAEALTTSRRKQDPQRCNASQAAIFCKRPAIMQ